MSYSSILKALDALVEYPDLQEYVKELNSPCGCIFTPEADPQRIDCAARLEQLLDANGMHSGASWGFLLRSVQAILTGQMTREKLLKKAAEEEDHMQLMRAKNAELTKARRQATEEAAMGDPLEEHINCQIINIIKV